MLDKEETNKQLQLKIDTIEGKITQDIIPDAPSAPPPPPAESPLLPPPPPAESPDAPAPPPGPPGNLFHSFLFSIVNKGNYIIIKQ